MSVALYDRTAALLQIDAWIEESAAEIAANEGALPDELAALLDEAEGAWEEKVERVALYVNSLGATADAIKTEENRLRERRKAHENAAKRLKAYLQGQLELVGREKVSRPLATVALQASPPAVQHAYATSDDAATLLGTEWRDFVRTSHAFDAALAKERHKVGQPLPPGVAVTHRKHLRIR